MVTFSVVETLKTAFKKVVDNVGLLLKSGLVALIVLCLPLLGILYFVASNLNWQTGAAMPVTAQLPPFAMFGPAIAFFLIWLLTDIIRLGFIKMSLNIVDNVPSSVSTLFASKHLLLRYILLAIAYRFAVAIGTLFFVIPGIIWAIQFYFVPQILVDKEVGIIEAFKISSRMTFGHKWQLLGFFIVTGFLSALGVGTGIGWVILLPVILVSEAILYRKLS